MKEEEVFGQKSGLGRDRKPFLSKSRSLSRSFRRRTRRVRKRRTDRVFFVTEFLRMHVFVTGGVQGVWFRESTRQKATELGVGGWVRNLPDGRVEAMFEGQSEAVRAAVEFVYDGPPLANVENVEVEEEPLEETDLPITVPFRVR
jgi:acylphosphatase